MHRDINEPPPVPVLFKCQWCLKTEFSRPSTHKKQRFCSTACRMAWHSKRRQDAVIAVREMQEASERGEPTFLPPGARMARAMRKIRLIVDECIGVAGVKGLGKYEVQARDKSKPKGSAKTKERIILEDESEEI